MSLGLASSIIEVVELFQGAGSKAVRHQSGVVEAVLDGNIADILTHMFPCDGRRAPGEQRLVWLGWVA